MPRSSGRPRDSEEPARQGSKNDRGVVAFAGSINRAGFRARHRLLKNHRGGGGAKAKHFLLRDLEHVTPVEANNSSSLAVCGRQRSTVTLLPEPDLPTKATVSRGASDVRTGSRLTRTTQGVGGRRLYLYCRFTLIAETGRVRHFRALPETRLFSRHPNWDWRPIFVHLKWD